MKKSLVVFLFLLTSFLAHAQKSVWPERYLAWTPNKYHIALTVTNPVGAISKYGVGLETRFKNVGYTVMYNKYIGAYPGAAYNFEMQIYMRNRWYITRRKWSYQNYIYWRGFMGSAAFNGDKLAVYGYPKNVYWPQDVDVSKLHEFGELYFGGAAGYGRRYNHGPLFFAVRTGLRGTAIMDLEKDIKSLYRLFYVTGPGSIVELNFQFGIQLF